MSVVRCQSGGLDDAAGGDVFGSGSLAGCLVPVVRAERTQDDEDEDEEEDEDDCGCLRSRQHMVRPGSG